MDTLYIISFVLMFCMIAYAFTMIIYSVIVTAKQDKKFARDLKVGDETHAGTVLKIEDDIITIEKPVKHPYVKLHKSMVYPLNYKANKYLFLFNNNKNYANR